MRRTIIATVLLLAACSEPATAVMVVVTADPSIMNDTRELRIRVAGGLSGDELGPAGETVEEVGPDSYPFVIPIIPRDNNGARMFEVEITARGNSREELVTARRISGFVRQETRALGIHLAESCRANTLPGPCLSPETCRDGSCVEAMVRATDLPRYEDFDAGTPNETDAGPVLDTCGDGDVDPPEACDDGNDQSFDGCEPGTCTTSCDDPSDCDDGNSCNGDETCGACVRDCASGRICEGGPSPDNGSPCIRLDGSDGICQASDCIAPPVGCGDGLVTAGELCYSVDGLHMISVPGFSSAFNIGAGNLERGSPPSRAFDIVFNEVAAGGRLVGLRNEGLGADGVPFFAAHVLEPMGPNGFGIADRNSDGYAEMFAPNFRCPGGGGPCLSYSEVDFSRPVGSQLDTRGAVMFDSGAMILGAGSGDLEGDGSFESAFVTLDGFIPRVTIVRAAPAPVYIMASAESDLAFGTLEPPVALALGRDLTGSRTMMGLRRNGDLERYPVGTGDVVMAVTSTRNIAIDPNARAFLQMADVMGTGSGSLLVMTYSTTGTPPMLHTVVIDTSTSSLSTLIDYVWARMEPAVFAIAFDLDKDSDLDGITVTRGAISLLVNDGSFAGPSFEIGFGCDATNAALGDFNGDTAVDIAVATSCGIHLLLADP